MELALFDFDGTISTGESTDAFIKYAIGDNKFNRGRIALLPLYVFYLTGLLDHHNAKERYLSYFLKGMPTSEFFKLSHEFGKNHIPGMLRSAAVEKITWHRDQGHEVSVVTGTCEVWLAHWCEEMKINLLGTRIDLSSGEITGKLVGRNCFKEEKASRITKAYRLDEYEKIYAYGDSKGDLAMFALADETFYKPFEK